MEEYRAQGNAVLPHIHSKYSAYMRHKSDVLSIICTPFTMYTSQYILHSTSTLGVLLHDENKLDEMGKILSHYMGLVPTMNIQQEISLPMSLRLITHSSSPSFSEGINQDVWDSGLE